MNIKSKISLFEGGKLWFYLSKGEGLGLIVLPWKCHREHIVELCDECTKFQFHTEKAFRDIPFFVIICIIFGPHCKRGMAITKGKTLVPVCSPKLSPVGRG